MKIRISSPKSVAFGVLKVIAKSKAADNARFAYQEATNVPRIESNLIPTPSNAEAKVIYQKMKAAVLESNLIPTPNNAEAKVFYQQMKADHLRVTLC